MSPTAHRKIGGMVLAVLLFGPACRAQSWSADGKQIAVGGPTLTLLDAP